MRGALVTIEPRVAGTKEEEEERAGSIWAGLHFVRQDRPTLAMLGLMASASLCVFPIMSVMLPLYARNDLHLNVSQAGLLMSVSGVGSLVASIGMLSVPRDRRILYMIAGVVDVALSLFVFSQIHGFWGAAASLATLAVGTSLIYGLANTTVQERAPGPLRGRVSAVASLSFIGVMPFASLGMTSLADHIGMRLTMIVAAGLYAVVGTVIFTGPGRHCGEIPAGASRGDAVTAAGGTRGPWTRTPLRSTNRGEQPSAGRSRPAATFPMGRSTACARTTCGSPGAATSSIPTWSGATR